MQSVDFQVQNTPWQRYMNTIRTDEDLDFEFDFTDSPFGTPISNPSNSGRGYDDTMEDSDFDRYAERTFKSLKRGSYSFTITSADYAQKWKDALKRAGFEVWNGLFVLVRSLKNRQLRRNGRFSKVFCEFGVVAWNESYRSERFALRLDEPYSILQCKYPLRIGVIDKIPVAMLKLVDPDTKKIFRVGEKSLDLLEEIFVTFNPEGGNTFDGFGGTMTMAIACLKTGRQCVVCEPDKRCFDLAV